MQDEEDEQDEDGEDSRPPESSVLTPLHPEKPLARALVLRARPHEGRAPSVQFPSLGGLEMRGGPVASWGVQWPTLAYFQPFLTSCLAAASGQGASSGSNTRCREQKVS